MLAKISSIYRSFKERFHMSVRHRVFWLISICVGLFWAINVFVPYIQMRQLSNYFVISVALFILLVVTPVAWKDFREDNLGRASQMIYGTWIVAMGVFAAFIWISIRQLVDLEWMRENALFPFFIWLISIGGMFYILSPNAYHTPLPRRNLTVFFVAFALAAVITLLFVRFSLLLYI